jgi:hypothetical protein
MKLLTSLEELEGKTIKRAELVYAEEKLALNFGDSYASFRIDRGWENGDESIYISDQELDMSEKLDAGIVTEQEYDKWSEAQECIQKERERKRAQEKIEKEKSELARLREKYPDE